MSRVFSWKLDDYKYGYIVPPEQNGSHISERITNNSILSRMAETVKSWDRNTYTEKFNELNNEVFTVFHVSIPGKAEDYFGDDKVDSNYIILTGKDGADNRDGNLKDEDLKKIEKAVSSKINIAMSEINGINSNLRAWVVDKTNSSIISAQTISERTIEEMTSINKELKDDLENAEESIRVAAALFDFDGNGITRDKLIGAISNSNSALTLASVANSKADSVVSQIEGISRNMDSLQNNQSNIDNRLKLVNETMLVNFGKITQKIDVLEEEVEDVKISSYETNSSTQETIAGSVRNNKSKNSVLTNVVKNGDGTHTLVINIGDENYLVNVVSKRENFSDVKKNGITISKNGFMYANEGVEFLISDGYIKMCNKSGGGSLLINEDGVFINGVKFESIQK